MSEGGKKRSLEKAMVSTQNTSKHGKEQLQKSRNIKRKTTPRTNESLYQLVKPDYYFDKHLRKVRPYYFEHQIYAKKRWLGQTIGSVLMDEFCDRSVEYYAAAMEQGHITINGQACTLDQVVRNRFVFLLYVL